MTAPDLTTVYNYDAFIPEKVAPWINFDASPPLGRTAPDFPLWHLDGDLTSLAETWSAHRLLVVEFGSFT